MRKVGFERFITKWGSLITLSVGLVLCVSLSCNHSVNDESDHESKVTILYIGDERIFFQDYWGMESAYLMFLPLVTQEGDNFGEIQGVLAEHWEHSADYKKWTFRLRKNVKWHDGDPVTAHDIKFTMDLRLHPVWSGGAEDRYSVEVIDDYNLVVRYKQPVDGLDNWSVYYPKHLLEDLDPKEFFSWDFWKSPVGNGPYRYVRHVPKTMVEVEANPDYYRGKPRIEHVVLKFSQEPSLTELMSGNVDALTFVGRDALLKFKQDGDYRAYHWWGFRIQSIFWNHNNPLFNKSEIRRALTLAIDRHELADVLNYPEGVPVLDVMVTSNQFKRSLFPEGLPYDPELASQLLSEAGWRDSDNNGVLDLDGTEFHFTVAVEAKNEKIAVYVQAQYRIIGVRMEVQVLERNTVWPKLKAGDFEAVIWGFENPSARQAGYTMFFQEDSPIGYASSEMMPLIKLLENTIDLEMRDSITADLMPIFAQDIPITMLFPEVQTHVVHKRLKGLSNHIRPAPVWFMEYLWLDETE